METEFIIKQRFLNPHQGWHGINATAIATIHGIGRNNGTIIDEIGKYYDLAVNGFGKSMPLHCTGYGEYSNQTNCRTYFSNGTPTFVNRYSLREWSHNNIDQANFTMIQKLSGCSLTKLISRINTTR